MFVAVTVAVLGGCGPVTYVGEVHHADDAVEAARTANAERYAPYWWTRATQYLHKARELAGHADWTGANQFGRLATEAANVAQQEAAVAAGDPSKRPLEGPAAGSDKPGIAPAKEPVAPDEPSPASGKDRSPVAPAKQPATPSAPEAPAKQPATPAPEAPAKQPAASSAPAKQPATPAKQPAPAAPAKPSAAAKPPQPVTPAKDAP